MLPAAPQIYASYNPSRALRTRTCVRYAAAERAAVCCTTGCCPAQSASRLVRANTGAPRRHRKSSCLLQHRLIIRTTLFLVFALEHVCALTRRKSRCLLHCRFMTGTTCLEACARAYAFAPPQTQELLPAAPPIVATNNPPLGLRAGRRVLPPSAPRAPPR